MRHIGFIFLAGIFYWSAINGGSVDWFFGPTSLIWVLGTLFAGLWVGFGPETIPKAFKAALFSRPADAKERRRFANFFRQGHQLSWGAGLIGMIINLVVMLQNMDDPSAIGPGMAMSLLVVLYGAVLAEFVFGPLNYAMIHRPTEQENDDDPKGHKKGKTIQAEEDDEESSHENTVVHLNEKMTGIASSVVFLLVAVFFILLVSMSEIKEEDVWQQKAQIIKQSFGPDGNKDAENLDGPIKPDRNTDSD